jgi:hypothetical protein
MIRFAIVVEPFGSLYVGGYTQAGGGSDGDTAADGQGLLLPGSAVKGALRESAARLVNGAGRGREVLEELFGKEEEKPGLLRLGNLRPLRPAEEGPPGGTVRNHVSLERATRQAAPQRLFQNRVTPAVRGLRFHGVLESRGPLSEEALGLLRAAVRITDQLGGGRGRGLGLVSVSLAELPAAPEPPPRQIGEAATLLLALEAAEPLHLSGVKDRTNYTTSKEHLDGSTIRGAVAAALAGRDAEQELLLGGAAPALFGDGRPGGPTAIPAPMTLQTPKRGDGPAADLAALLCAAACGGRSIHPPDDMRTAKGTWGREGGGNHTAWSPVTLQRRTVTRTARDHASGRAADGLLYSLEVLDPAGDGSRCFYAPVSGSREQLALVVRAAEGGLTVGGDRSRGFGRLRLAEVIAEPPLPALAERHAAWAGLVGRLGVPRPEATGVLLAVGPLAVSHARLLEALRAAGLDLKDGVARRQMNGGWNVRESLPRSLSSQLLPGSVLVVARTDGGSALSALAELETNGIGPGRADGWGRLIACHPIHLDCCKEE